MTKDFTTTSQFVIVWLKFPQVCYCRKPMPGIGVEFIEKYKLDPSQCIMVGDMKVDNTFANRCGFQFVQADEFFKA